VWTKENIFNLYAAKKRINNAPFYSEPIRLKQGYATMQDCRAKCAQPDWSTGYNCMCQALRVRQLAGHPWKIGNALQKP